MQFRRNRIGSRSCLSASRSNRLRQLSEIVLQFGNFFLKLFKNARDLRPIKSNRSRLAAELGGFKKRGHGSRNTIQGGLPLTIKTNSLLRFLSLLGFFDRLPIAYHFPGGIRFRVAKHMWMTIDQFTREAIEYVIDRKVSSFPGHLRIEQHLEQQVS